MPRSRLLSPGGLHFLTFAALAVLYCAVMIWIYLMVPALAGALGLVAVAIVLAGEMERTAPS